MSRTSAIRVRTRFDTVDAFVVGYSPFFDARGVFIRTRRIQELGSRVRFELQLSDGSAVFRGEGVVDEVREPPLSASGMHLRIAKLDRSSSELFERITADLHHVGGDPFEAPTFDPDNPPPGLTADILDQAARAAEAHVEAGLEAPEAPPAPASTSPLDAGVLDEIAEGIELSLDAVWSSGGSDLGGAADLGGYFGSPDVLESAGMTPQGGAEAVAPPPPIVEPQIFQPAVDEAPAAEPAISDAFEIAPEEMGFAVEPESGLFDPSDDDLVIAPNEVGLGGFSAEPEAPAGKAVERSVPSAVVEAPSGVEFAGVELLGSGSSEGFDQAVGAAVLRTGARTQAPPPAEPDEPEFLEPAFLEPEPAEPEFVEPEPVEPEFVEPEPLGFAPPVSDPEPIAFAPAETDLAMLERPAGDLQAAAVGLELGPEDPFYLSSPGEPPSDTDDEEAFDLLDEAFDEAELVEDEEEEILDVEILDEAEVDLSPAEALFVNAEPAPISPAEELFEVPLEAGDERDGERLGDHSLALASNYVAEPEPEEFEIELIEPEPEELEPLVEEPEPEPAVAPLREGPDLGQLATATLEHSPLDDAETSHLRYRFTIDDQKAGLGSLLHDLIDDEQSAQSSREIDLAALTGEHEVTSDAGPDAIDEFLAREAASEQQTGDKGGLLKRLFGRKKK